MLFEAVCVLCALLAFAWVLLLAHRWAWALTWRRHLRRGGGACELAAAVVVCGDIARSPRMQYHAVSLCNARCAPKTGGNAAPALAFACVHVVGADMGNRCCEKLCELERGGRAVFHLVREDESSRAAATASKEGWARRVVRRVVSLVGVYWDAVRETCADRRLAFVLVQSPPVLPALAVIWLAVLLENVRRAAVAATSFGDAASAASAPPIRLVFDVHNLGWTILRAERRPLPFVWLYRAAELVLCGSGLFSDARVTVSEALADHLRASFGGAASPVHVMPDAAPDFFKPKARSDFAAVVRAPGRVEFGALGSNVPAWYTAGAAAASSAADGGADGSPRTLVVAGSTSWTADDDYTVVVDALRIVDATLRARRSQSRLWLFVSGKGPARGAFEDAVRRLRLARANDDDNKDENVNASAADAAAAVGTAAAAAPVTVTTGYFQSFGDYATFVGAADLGLCLHHSSSNLDLPMKGVDMLGAGLPVAALRYEPALPELVTPLSGWLFDSARELAALWLALLGVPGDGERAAEGGAAASLQRLRDARAYVRQHRKFWDATWDERVRPLVAQLAGV
jgi:beta-1,4-mannosyltransferase